jgi:hypothetical protein
MDKVFRFHRKRKDKREQPRHSIGNNVWSTEGSTAKSFKMSYDLQQRNTVSNANYVDDIDDIFFARGTEKSVRSSISSNGGSNNHRSSRSSARSQGCRATQKPAQFRAAFSNRLTEHYRITHISEHSPPPQQKIYHGNDKTQLDLKILKEELNILKSDVQAMRREMMNEMHVTRYDILKELALFKGTIMQLVSTGVQANHVEDVEPQSQLSPEDLKAISRNTANYVSKAVRNQRSGTVEYRGSSRGSLRMTYLAPVDVTTLSRPLSQDQINES